MSALHHTAGQNVSRALRVLIVDDNPGDRFLYKQMLVETAPGTQFSFEEAVSGTEALARVTAVRPDCVLLDYFLPDMVGIELLKSLSESVDGAVLPVVMLTDFGDETTAADAVRNGAHGYISKRELTGPGLNRAIDRAVRTCATSASMERSRREIAEMNRELDCKYRDIRAIYSKLITTVQSPAKGLRDALAELSGSPRDVLPERREQRLNALREDAERLVMSLADLADDPGLNLGRLLLSTGPTSIIELVSDSVNTFRPAAESAGVRLSVNVQPGLPEVQVDRRRIRQLLANLLDNAIQSTPKRGKVYLSVDRFPRSPEEITVCISDAGAGIAGELPTGIFNPESAVGDSEKWATGGIGLRICREIVRAHGGRIAIRGLPGDGTCFTFTLPVGVAETSAPRRSGGRATRSAGSAHRLDPRVQANGRAAAG